MPAFSETLRRKAGAGCRLRFLIAEPEGHVTRDRERAEKVTLTVTGGKFDRFAEHAEELWGQGRHVPA
ncbi:hypothetical protein [Streptomyces monomycini]|uniref:hypothetical protein n=1 Tax=Streptomyces monomycini TaxID=371720 RepID=UPI0027E37E92|nr:hypothetical protein [Streptomyces monomycini]